MSLGVFVGYPNFKCITTLNDLALFYFILQNKLTAFTALDGNDES